jgi:LacI family transcriptional regulator
MRKLSLTRIAGLLPTTFGHSRQVMAGAMDYLQPHPHHDVLWFQQEFPPPSHLKEWKVDGIIGQFNRYQPAKPYLKLNVPVVNVSSLPQAPPVVNVTTDHLTIGRLAALHLFQCGLREFAYLGLTERRFSKGREEGFKQGLTGTTYRRLILPHKMWDWPQLIEEWLDTLPRPCGVFCAGDNEARLLISVCRARDVRVPEDVAVIGANNEEDICLSTRPSLSSVPDRARKIGQVGMELLEKMICDRESVQDMVLDPFPVVQRGSTDVLFAVDDPELSAALAYIREHIGDGIGVQQVVEHTGVSRRTLESRFKAQLGRSPLAEIHRVRLDLIRQRLRDSQDSLQDIADAAGIATVNHLCGFFRKHENRTPGEYRERMREKA